MDIMLRVSTVEAISVAVTPMTKTCITGVTVVPIALAMIESGHEGVTMKVVRTLARVEVHISKVDLPSPESMNKCILVVTLA